MNEFLPSISCLVVLLLSHVGVAQQQPPIPSGGSPDRASDDDVDKERSPLTGTLIVLNKAEATASFIDLASGEETARIPTGEGPHEVAVSPDGATAVVANYGGQQNPGNSLTVIDVTTKSVTKTIDLGAFRRPHGVVFLADGNRVLVTAEVNRSLLVVDLAVGEVVQVFNTDAEISHMVAVTPWRPDWPVPQRAFVSNIGSGSICAFELESGKVLGEVVTAPGAEGIDVSADGREVWVANRAADTITVLDSQSLAIVSSIDCASFPIRLKFTPDGSNVLVSNARTGDVAVFDARTRAEITRIRMDEEPVDDPAGRLFAGAFEGSPVPVGILVHPAGDYAFIANTQADVVTMIDLRSFVIVGRIKAGREPDGLGFSPLELAADDSE
jgi:YVTN family beta-propeller protein